MKFGEKSMLFVRRLSVFYIFLAVLAVVFGLYYYKYVPSNEQELEERGQRTLRQLSENFLNSCEQLKTIFDNNTGALPDTIQNHLANFSYFYKRTPYVVEEPSATNLPANNFFLFNDEHDNTWKLSYIKILGDKKLAINIPLSRLLQPLLGIREDIFDTYVVLQDSSKSSKPKNLPILYQQLDLSASPILNADTVISLQKNSDLSAVSDIKFAGAEYKTFFHAMPFYGQRLILAGLIRKTVYDEKVHATPLSFIPLSIIGICLLMISLPFIKIFFLSQRESIYAKDVWFTAISLYAGSAVACMIIFYIGINLITPITFQKRLNDMGQHLHTDIDAEIFMANQQLAWYDDNINKLLPDNDTETSNADSLLAPKIYKQVNRLFWVDSAGNTIVKWNPFNFKAPKTIVKSHDFFQLLNKKIPHDDSSGTSSFHIVYAGKSDITGEFQLQLVRPSHKIFAKKNDRSYGVVMNFFLHCMTRPIVPRGFGFCVIDANGKILIDVDERLNLSANLLDESANNPILKHAISYRDSTILADISLYGEPCSARVFPLKGQPLYLVTYYNKRILSENIERLIHFTIQTLAYSFAALALCIFLTSLQQLRPKILKFRLQNIEWIRPIASNRESYVFTSYYFGWLLLISLIYSFVIGSSNDLRPLYYISVLLPWYVLIGFVVSRKKNMSGKFSAFEIISTRGWPWLFLFLANFVICLVSDDHGTCVILFQLLCLAGFLFSYYFIQRKKRCIDAIDFRTNYFISLYLTILLISVIPTAGLLTYAFSAEKIQYKKEKLFRLAEGYEGHLHYMANELLPAYKPALLKNLGSERDTLCYNRSIYLTDRDYLRGETVNDATNDIHLASATTGQTDKSKKEIVASPIADDLYRSLMDSWYLAGEFGNEKYSVPNIAADSSWQFKTADTPHNLLNLFYHRLPVEQKYTGLKSSSNLESPIADFGRLSWNLRYPIYAIILILLVAYGLMLKGAVSRLFLGDFMDKNKVDVDCNYLEKLINTYPPKPIVLNGVKLSSPLKIKDFDIEFNKINEKGNTAEEYIMAVADSLANSYERIWQSLSQQERYTLYDFGVDHYTNYKNTTPIYSLIHKGILAMRENNSQLVIFSRSFRQYILSKEGTKEIKDLKEQFNVPGRWDALRIPVLSLIAVVAIFIVSTQSEFTHTIIVLLTSLTALVPLVQRAFEKPAALVSKAKDS